MRGILRLEMLSLSGAERTREGREEEEEEERVRGDRKKGERC